MPKDQKKSPAISASDEKPRLDSPAPSRHAEIPLHRPCYDEAEANAARSVVESGMVQGGGLWLQKTEELIQERLETPYARLVTSCTHALESAAMALELSARNEVVVPTFGFPTSASAFIRQGCKVRFADSGFEDPEPGLQSVLNLVTAKTKAIVVVHYAGDPFDVDQLRVALGDKTIAIIEDAAQAFDSRLRGRACGTLGDLGCISFHGTKNLTCGEGGLIISSNAEIDRSLSHIREMGTNRREFMNGEIDRYSWCSIGSSFLPSEISSAILCAQLAKADHILARRRILHARYLGLLAEAAERYDLLLPRERVDAQNNGHIFWVAFPTESNRQKVQTRLSAAGIEASTHFHPLDQSPYGRKLCGGPSHQALPNAKRFHRTLLRLPIYPDLTESDQDRVVDEVLKALG
ncbi:MAG: DegT/DnrJ/EryC1/StrS family aminotransferase [Planctomycetota bacterium]